MTDSLLVVQTAPREGASYLDATLKELAAQGGEDACIFPDVAARGSLHAFWAILAAVEDLPADVIILQDDVIPCIGAVDAARKLVVPADLPFVSMFDSDHGGTLPVGLRYIDLAGPFRHAQALKLPNRTVRALVRSGKPRTPFQHGHGSDWAMGLALYDLGWRQYGLTSPSWFQHVGEVSAVNPGRSRSPTAKDWRREYDARGWMP